MSQKPAYLVRIDEGGWFSGCGFDEEEDQLFTEAEKGSAFNDYDRLSADLKRRGTGYTAAIYSLTRLEPKQ